MANSGQEGLTVREQEILKLLLKRWSTSEIAGLVGISDRTAETHVSHILGKLGFHSRQELWKLLGG